MARSDFYGDYPDLWRAGLLQHGSYAIAGWRCEHCGMAFIPGTTKAVSERNRDGKPVILTVHHIDGNKANCAWTNLVAVCQRCHLHIQAVWRPGDRLPAAWDGVPDWITKRKLPYRPPVRQLVLWEVEKA